MSAHIAVGGSRAGRRWATEELNHALVLRLASEFQGFCRDLHDEALGGLLLAVAPADSLMRKVLRFPYRTCRSLDRGNADPACLGNDFGLIGVRLWQELREKYPMRAEEWRSRLELLNDARNGIAHDDETKLAKVREAGWPLTLASVRKWRRALDGLAKAMDDVTRASLSRMEVDLWREERA